MENWFTCPVLAYWKRGWEPRALEWQPNMLLGIAIGNGLDVFYRQTMDGPPARDPHMATADAIAAGYVENDKWTKDGLIKLAEKGLNKALDKAQAIVEQESVVAVQWDLGECKPDLVTRRRVDRKLIVTDHKFTLNLDARWREKRMAKYDVNHQLLHYAWRVGELVGEEVEWVRLHLTVGNPTAGSFLHSVRITPEQLALWLRGAKWAWAQRGVQDEHAKLTERPSRAYPPNINSCTNGPYGPCPFKAACWELDGDESKMDGLYKRRGTEDAETGLDG